MRSIKNSIDQLFFNDMVEHSDLTSLKTVKAAERVSEEPSGFCMVTSWVPSGSAVGVVAKMALLLTKLVLLASIPPIYTEEFSVNPAPVMVISTEEPTVPSLGVMLSRLSPSSGGSDVGSDVGSEVGSAVGSEVGSDVGSDVGCPLGSEVGSAVGSEVGSDVGSELG